MTERIPVKTLFLFFQSLSNRGQRSHSVGDSELFCFDSPVCKVTVTKLHCRFITPSTNKPVVIIMCSPHPLLYMF